MMPPLATPGLRTPPAGVAVHAFGAGAPFAQASTETRIKARFTPRLLARRARGAFQGIAMSMPSVPLIGAPSDFKR
jgi:hypothetical protein